MTGNETPSSWTNTAPRTWGSATRPGLVRINAVAKVSSVPALSSQVRMVPKSATTHDATTAVQKDSKWAPGTMARASCRTTAWPKRAPRPTATQPTVATAATMSGTQESIQKPGRSHAAAPRASTVSAHDNSIRTTSAPRTRVTAPCSRSSRPLGSPRQGEASREDTPIGPELANLAGTESPVGGDAAQAGVDHGCDTAAHDD